MNSLHSFTNSGIGCSRRPPGLRGSKCVEGLLESLRFRACGINSCAAGGNGGSPATTAHQKEPSKKNHSKQKSSDHAEAMNRLSKKWLEPKWTRNEELFQIPMNYLLWLSFFSRTRALCWIFVVSCEFFFCTLLAILLVH